MADHQPLSNLVQTSRTVTINLVNDSVPEPTAGVNPRLQNPTNPTLADDTEPATIPNTAHALHAALPIYDISVNENTGAATFTVSLSAASTQTVSVLYSTLVGTANAAGPN